MLAGMGSDHEPSPDLAGLHPSSPSLLAGPREKPLGNGAGFPYTEASFTVSAIRQTPPTGCPSAASAGIAGEVATADQTCCGTAAEGIRIIIRSVNLTSGGAMPPSRNSFIPCIARPGTSYR